MKEKLGFDGAFDALNDGFPLHSADVKARAMDRYVWVAEWHLPGCLSESSCVTLTKTAAIAAALNMAAGADGPPRGMRRDLARYGISRRSPPDDYVSDAVTTIARLRLAELLAP